MAGFDDTLNSWKDWRPNMRPPVSFDSDRVAAYQKRIDNLVGTAKGKPIIKLAWAPSELRWRPHHMGDDPPGYTFPIFIALWDKDGNEVAAPRWVLLQRAEPEQYASTWEAGRYSVAKGHVWDWKGPCPSERYTELWRHCYHDGSCCTCVGNECKCDKDCWGLYAEPNDELLAIIGEMVEQNKGDSDIQPTRDAQHFQSPNAQRELTGKIAKKEELEKIDRERRQEDDRAYYESSPVSFNMPSGMKRTESGLIVFDN